MVEILIVLGLLTSLVVGLVLLFDPASLPGDALVLGMARALVLIIVPMLMYLVVSDSGRRIK